MIACRDTLLFKSGDSFTTHRRTNHSINIWRREKRRMNDLSFSFFSYSLSLSLSLLCVRVDEVYVADAVDALSDCIRNAICQRRLSVGYNSSITHVEIQIFLLLPFELCNLKIDLQLFFPSSVLLFENKRLVFLRLFTILKKIDEQWMLFFSHHLKEWYLVTCASFRSELEMKEEIVIQLKFVANKQCTDWSHFVSLISVFFFFFFHHQRPWIWYFIVTISRTDRFFYEFLCILRCALWFGCHVLDDSIAIEMVKIFNVFTKHITLKWSLNF